VPSFYYCSLAADWDLISLLLYQALRLTKSPKRLTPRTARSLSRRLCSTLSLPLYASVAVVSCALHLLHAPFAGGKGCAGAAVHIIHAEQLLQKVCSGDSMNRLCVLVLSCSLFRLQLQHYATLSSKSSCDRSGSNFRHPFPRSESGPVPRLPRARSRRIRRGAYFASGLSHCMLGSTCSRQ
jgi:hypothetical protein